MEIAKVINDLRIISSDHSIEEIANNTIQLIEQLIAENGKLKEHLANARWNNEYVRDLEEKMHHYGGGWQ